MPPLSDVPCRFKVVKTSLSVWVLTFISNFIPGLHNRVGIGTNPEVTIGIELEAPLNEVSMDLGGSIILILVVL